MEARKRKRCLRRKANTRTGGSRRSRWTFTLGVAVYLAFASTIIASYADKAHDAHNLQPAALPPSPKVAVIVEKDTIEKFGKDVAIVLHVLKASEYGSDPTVPGTKIYCRV